MASAHPHPPHAPQPGLEEAFQLDTGAAEFHFGSDEALRSGVAMARSQSWVAEYRVDDARLTLWVRFARGAEARSRLH